MADIQLSHRQGYCQVEFPVSAHDMTPVDPRKCRRPGFHKGTKDYMYDSYARSYAVAGDTAFMIRCQACGQPGAAGDMDIGHVVPWRDYFIRVGVATKTDVILAYNDVRNLRLEHACCNRSHRFEDHHSREPHRDGAEIFAELVLKSEQLEGATSAEYVINERSDLALVLAEPIVHHTSDTQITDWKEFKRPNWDKNTRAGLLQIWRQLEMTRKGDPATDGTDKTFYMCASCGLWGLGYDMHIGHVKNWMKYLKEVGVSTKAEAQWAYNDLNNLQFEHAKCNLGHEWEDYDPDDPEFAFTEDELREVIPVAEYTSDGEGESVSEDGSESEEDVPFDPDWHDKLREILDNSNRPAVPFAPPDDGTSIHFLMPRRVVTIMPKENPSPQEELLMQENCPPPMLPEPPDDDDQGSPSGVDRLALDDDDVLSDEEDGRKQKKKRRRTQSSAQPAHKPFFRDPDQSGDGSGGASSSGSWANGICVAAGKRQ